MPRNTKNRNGSLLYWSAESWAFLSLRLFLSLHLFTAGLGKFMGENGFAFSNFHNGTAKWIIGAFESTWLPGFLVAPYAHLIAYVQVIISVLLFLGVKTKYTLALFALTYVSLAFGQMLRGAEGRDTVQAIAIYLILNCAALYLVRHNKLELKR